MNAKGIKLDINDKFTAYLKLIRFDRPIGTLLLLWPTIIAVMLSSKGNPKISVLIIFIIGVFLTRAAGCAINDYADSEIDKKVERTKGRPLAIGAISKIEALLVALILSFVAFILAICFLNFSTVLMCIPALFIFMLYPFTKRFFAYPQFILSIAFSFGILMAFIQNVGYINISGWMLFLANLFWVFGYDTIYAMVDLEDDLKIGIKTSAISLDRFVIKVITVSYALFIFFMVLIGLINHLNYLYYVGIVIAASLLSFQIKILIDKDRRRYFDMFLLNNWVGLILFVGLCLSLDLFIK